MDLLTIDVTGVISLVLAAVVASVVGGGVKAAWADDMHLLGALYLLGVATAFCVIATIFNNPSFTEKEVIDAVEPALRLRAHDLQLIETHDATYPIVAQLRPSQNLRWGSGPNEFMRTDILIGKRHGQWRLLEYFEGADGGFQAVRNDDGFVNARHYQSFYAHNDGVIARTRGLLCFGWESPSLCVPVVAMVYGPAGVVVLLLAVASAMAKWRGKRTEAVRQPKAGSRTSSQPQPMLRLSTRYGWALAVVAAFGVGGVSVGWIAFGEGGDINDSWGGLKAIGAGLLLLVILGYQMIPGNRYIVANDEGLTICRNFKVTHVAWSAIGGFSLTKDADAQRPVLEVKIDPADSDDGRALAAGEWFRKHRGALPGLIGHKAEKVLALLTEQLCARRR